MVGSVLEKKPCPVAHHCLYIVVSWTHGSQGGTLPKSIFLLVTLLSSLHNKDPHSSPDSCCIGPNLDFLHDSHLPTFFSVLASCAQNSLFHVLPCLTVIPRNPFQTLTSSCHASYTEPSFPSLHSPRYSDCCGGWGLGSEAWLPDLIFSLPKPSHAILLIPEAPVSSTTVLPSPLPGRRSLKSQVSFFTPLPLNKLAYCLASQGVSAFSSSIYPPSSCHVVAYSLPSTMQSLWEQVLGLHSSSVSSQYLKQCQSQRCCEINMLKNLSTLFVLRTLSSLCTGLKQHAPLFTHQDSYWTSSSWRQKFRFALVKSYLPAP